MTGNIHAFNHRVTALSVACMASAGLICLVLSGLSCEYLKVTAQPDRILATPGGIEFVGETTASLGVQCPIQVEVVEDTTGLAEELSSNRFFTDEDRMWYLSRIFWYTASSLGATTTILAWILSIFIPPRAGNWRVLSILSACAAVMGVPVFLIFESEPCTMDINRQTCSLGFGAYLNIAAVGLYIFMTLLTQCLNPPNWKMDDKKAWTNTSDNRQRRPAFDLNEITIPGGSDEYGGTDGTSTPRNGSPNPNRTHATANDQFPPMRDFDNGSEVSSISNGDERTAMKDVELGPPTMCHPTNSGRADIYPTPISQQQQQQAYHSQDRRGEVDRTKSILDSQDHDIRRGASIVINALKEKRDATLRKFREKRHSSSAVSNQSQSEEGKDMQNNNDNNNDYGDDDDDEITESNQQQRSSSKSNSNSNSKKGLDLTVLCTAEGGTSTKGDDSNEPLSPFSCTDAPQVLLEQTVELVKTASKLAAGNSRTVATTEEMEKTKEMNKKKSLDVVITHTMEQPIPLQAHRRQQSQSHSVRTPITAVTIEPISGQYGFDGVSEMTPAVSDAFPRPQDTLGILEDLAREY